MKCDEIEQLFSKRLGFGCMRLPLKDISDKKSIDYELFEKMITIYLQNGYKYFDTGYAYNNGASEIALRECLVKKYPREQFLICDKLPLYLLKTYNQMDSIFSEQLEKCGIQYFDYYLLHAVTRNNVGIIKALDIFSYLTEKKRLGMINHIGISFHDSADLLDKLLVEYPEIEIVQLQLNYLDWDNILIQSKECYEVAIKHNKKIIVMEPLKGGSLINIPDNILMQEEISKEKLLELAFSFLLEKNNVVMILSGMNSLENISQNLSLFEKFRPLQKDDLDLIRRIKAALNSSNSISCTSCNYCTNVCPNKIRIPESFSLYNNYKQYGKNQLLITNMYYSTLRQSISTCIKCGLCLKNCPQHLDIPLLLEKINKEMFFLSFVNTKKKIKQYINSSKDD